jgi:hypothetical protein
VALLAAVFLEHRWASKAACKYASASFGLESCVNGTVNFRPQKLHTAIAGVLFSHFVTIKVGFDAMP